MRFKGIVHGRQTDPVDQWIDDETSTNLVPFMRFARTLHRDVYVVRSGIELPWSNGQAEGQITRLKTLKRAFYGTGGQNLLRSRMLPLRHTV